MPEIPSPDIAINNIYHTCSPPVRPRNWWNRHQFEALVIDFQSSKDTFRLLSWPDLLEAAPGGLWNRSSSACSTADTAGLL